MNDINKKVITRFAPSPTGFMHVGGVRTALYAWLFARKNNGTMILRIEDTDKEREVPGSIAHIIESLKWVGIDWDEGPDIGGPNAPYLQSERLDSYKKYAQILIDKGLAYADPYSEEELESFRKQAEDNKKPFLYRNHRPENPPAWDGTKPLRLKIVDPQKTKWHDLARGDLEAGPEALDDFILIKSDGYPTYNFAHIIDDLEMGVTHIFRADEFISSTPKFLALYEALEIQRPAFVTLPPIMGPDGKKKLGKRDGAKDLLDYRSDGYLPEAIANFLALIGWHPGGNNELFSIQELKDLFTIEKIHKSGGNFNDVKLKWVNKEHMLKLSHDEYKKNIEMFIPEHISTLDTYKPRIDKVIEVVRDRLEYFKQVQEMYDAGDFEYFFIAPLYNPELLICSEKMRKGIDVTSESLSKILSVCKKELENIEKENWNKDSVKEVLWPIAEREGRGIVLWAIRVSLSGKEKSPDPFTMGEIVGREETLARIQRAVSLLGEKVI